jgi:hypothetical protein
LSKAADRTAQSLNGLVVNVRSLGDKCDFVDEFLRRQPRLALIEKHDCPKAGGDTTAQLKVSEDGIEIWSALTPTGDHAPEGDEKLPAYLKFGVRLRDLLAEIPFGDALDLLLIADGTGKVIAQHHPNGRPDIGLKLTSLEGLPLVDGGARLISADLQRSSATRTVQVAGADYELLCQPFSEAAPDANAAAKPADQAKGPPAPTNSAPQPTRWVICGLVASRGELTQALQVAPFLALFLFAAIVFAFLTWPLLKLLLMSERDRLQFADLCFLLIGTWAAVMLATILVLSAGVDQQLRARSERSLEELASKIEQNLQQEVERLRSTVVSMDETLAERLKQQNVSITRLKDISDLLDQDSKMGTATEASATAQERELDRLHSDIVSAWGSENLADTDVVFWVNCTDGKQFLKATIKKANTPRISLLPREREYFSAVLLDRLWASPTRPADPTKPAEPASRFVQPLRSIITGEFATVVSVKSRIPTPGKSPCTNMAAIQAKLVATTHPVLSPGVGFAIVDEQGKAVLHSDERRALFENLFEEMDDGQRLRAIVQAREAASFTTNYMGRPHQVYVQPLAELPWFVVAFSGTETITTMTVEIIGHAFILSLVYLTLFVLVAGLYWIAKGPEIPRWLWPNAHRPEWSVTISTAALAAFGLAAWLADGDALLVIAMLIPLAVVGSLYFLYCRRGARSDLPLATSQMAQVRASVAAAYAIWVIIAIVPAGLFFKSATESQDRLMMRDEGEHLTQQLAHRSCALEDDYRDVNLGGVCTDCEFPPRRLVNASDLYPSTMFDPDASYENAELPRWFPDRPNRLTGRLNIKVDKTALVGGDAPSKPAEDFWSWAEWLKPIYNETTIRTRYLDRKPTNEQRVKGAEWFHSRRGTTEIYGASALACGTQVTIASSPPRVLGERFFWWTVPLGAVLAAALFLWVRYGARRIFFGDIKDPFSPDLAGLTSILESTPARSSCWLVATVTSPRDRAALLAASGDDAAKSDSFARIDASAYRAGPAERKKLLWTLDGLTEGGGNVLIVSAADPYTLLSPADLRGPATTQTASGATKPAADSFQMPDPDHSRWCLLLTRARFVTVAIARPPTSRDATFWGRGLDEVVEEPWLDDELATVPDQPESRSRLLHQLVGSTRRQALDRIVDYAAAYYVGLWDACSEAEKLVLVQLAFENVVNPKQSVVIRRLLERGLLLRDPALRLFNRSFALFITRVHDPAEVSEWERHTTGFSWAETRWVLFGFLLIASLFLWATQRELFNTSVMFLSAAAAGLPAVLKLASDLTRSDKKT